MKKETVNPAGAAKPQGPYSPAVKAGDFLFISGQIPLDPETGKIIESTSFQDHVKRTMDNIVLLLDAAGLTPDDLVKATVYLDNLDNFSAFNEVYLKYFKEDLPTRAVVEVNRFRDPRQIEIEAIALLRK